MSDGDDPGEPGGTGVGCRLRDWESIRISVYRIQPHLDPEREDEFKRECLHKMQDKVDQYSVLGLTTGALFGLGIKPLENTHLMGKTEKA